MRFSTPDLITGQLGLGCLLGISLDSWSRVLDSSYLVVGENQASQSVSWSSAVLGFLSVPSAPRLHHQLNLPWCPAGSEVLGVWGEQSRQLLLLKTAGRQGVRAREPVVVSLWAFPGPGMVLLHLIQSSLFLQMLLPGKPRQVMCHECLTGLLKLCLGIRNWTRTGN